MRISHRLARLEQIEAEARPSRIVIRYESPDGQVLSQPTQEELDNATEIIVVRFVESPGR